MFTWHKQYIKYIQYLEKSCLYLSVIFIKWERLAIDAK